MTRIKTIPSAEADDRLREARDAQHKLYPPEYDAPVLGIDSDVAGIVAAHSLIPDALYHAFATFGALMSPVWAPAGSGARLDYLDPVSGRVGSRSETAREIWLPPVGQKDTPPGQFHSCPRCGERGEYIMDHITKGDEPFQEIVSSQLLEQPPRPGVDTPLNDGLAMMEGKTPQEIAEASAGNLQPVPWIEASDVAEAVRFLVSDKARFVTGSQFVLDAGLLTA